MKRDWDVIRAVLIEAEGLSPEERNSFTYAENTGQDISKVEHALLLWKAGFLEGMDASAAGGAVLLCPKLTWQGHDLLDTLRSTPVWERIKTTAKEKGLELTFDVVMGLGKLALDYVMEQGS